MRSTQRPVMLSWCARGGFQAAHFLQYRGRATAASHPPPRRACCSAASRSQDWSSKAAACRLRGAGAEQLVWIAPKHGLGEGPGAATELRQPEHACEGEGGVNLPAHLPGLRARLASGSRCSTSTPHPHLCVLEGVPPWRHVAGLRQEAGQVAPQGQAHHRAVQRAAQRRQRRHRQAAGVHPRHQGTATAWWGVASQGARARPA